MSTEPAGAQTVTATILFTDLVGSTGQRARLGEEAADALRRAYDRMLAEGFTPIARWGEPDDVGRAVAMLARGDLSFVTGEAIHVDGGMHIHRY